MQTDKRKSIDLLVEQFWRQGYLTLSRKFGTYLPEPSKIGLFDVDVVARYKKSYALGITLTDEDFRNPKLIQKINYLASRQTKFTKKKVMLFVGVPDSHYKTARSLIQVIDPEVRKNIRLFAIVDKSISFTANSMRNDIFVS